MFVHAQTAVDSQPPHAQVLSATIVGMCMYNHTTYVGTKYAAHISRHEINMGSGPEVSCRWWGM